MDGFTSVLIVIVFVCIGLFKFGGFVESRDIKNICLTQQVIKISNVTFECKPVTIEVNGKSIPF